MRKELEDLKRDVTKLLVETEEVVEHLDGNQKYNHLSNLTHILQVIKSAGADYSNVINLMERLIKSDNLTPRENALFFVFAYLMMAEGVICNILNYLSYLLVMTGHDLFSLTKRKYVKPNFEEIRRVEMSTKIQFLNHHGFGALTKEYDSTLRNDIAHHNYLIDEKGTLWVRGKSIVFSSKMKSLANILEFVEVTLTERYEKMLSTNGDRLETGES